MRVLFLTSKLGYGHLRAAEAVAEAFSALDPTVEVEWLDFWSLMSTPIADGIKNTYLELTNRHPDVYERLYQLEVDDWQRLLAAGHIPHTLRGLLEQLRENAAVSAGWRGDQGIFVQGLGLLLRPGPGKAIRRQLIAWVRALLARRAAAHIRRFQPDVVIASQLLLPALLTPERRAGRLPPAAWLGILTDYGVHDLWVQAALDHYCVATDAVAADLERRLPLRGSVTATGIPLRRGFRPSPSAEEARRQLGLAADAPIVLVTGGQHGIGVGPVLERLRAARLPCRIVATGKGEAPEDQENATPLQFIEVESRMPLLLRAADVVVGKPGGLTVSESLACGRPFFATCCLGGQEGFNVRYLEEHGAGRLVEPEVLPGVLRQLLDDRPRLHALQARAEALGHPEAASDVAHLVAELVRQQKDAGRWHSA